MPFGLLSSRLPKTPAGLPRKSSDAGSSSASGSGSDTSINEPPNRRKSSDSGRADAARAGVSSDAGKPPAAAGQGAPQAPRRRPAQVPGSGALAPGQSAPGLPAGEHSKKRLPVDPFDSFVNSPERFAALLSPDAPAPPARPTPVHVEFSLERALHGGGLTTQTAGLFRLLPPSGPCLRLVPPTPAPGPAPASDPFGPLPELSQPVGELAARDPVLGCPTAVRLALGACPVAEAARLRRRARFSRLSPGLLLSQLTRSIPHLQAASAAASRSQLAPLPDSPALSSPGPLSASASASSLQQQQQLPSPDSSLSSLSLAHSAPGSSSPSSAGASPTLSSVPSGGSSSMSSPLWSHGGRKSLNAK
ncbi:hypothetical protein, variant [Fonticula alba]|uniref:Uncharacterized protein n=1 Tax=Fonticula alba TaxID=691883 RepID=A0A058Z5T0_FONAL|nr:hypothetical protein, variant [Fonticula alba]KCV69298.1 hypothetical protein, variant [Fonticula alba]|eukprot:XP_009495863.1 hypothetical protein, variant [Fonticula alba]